MSKQATKVKSRLERMGLPDLQARFREVTGETSRSPNRKFLIRRIEEATASRAETTPRASARAKRGRRAAEDGSAAPAQTPTPPTPPPTSTPDAPPTVAPASAPPPRGRFTAMSVEELKAKYVEVVGRPTGSSSKAYLVWKIREAEKGRVPVGPRKGRQSKGEPNAIQILPVRLEAAVVDKMDEAWRSRGMKSRMDFFRKAFGHYLAHLGAREAADAFTEASSDT